MAFTDKTGKLGQELERGLGLESEGQPAFSPEANQPKEQLARRVSKEEIAAAEQTLQHATESIAGRQQPAVAAAETAPVTPGLKLEGDTPTDRLRNFFHGLKIGKTTHPAEAQAQVNQMVAEAKQAGHDKNPELN